MVHEPPRALNLEAPGVSVIVPVYNGEATIEDCLRSLLRLDRPGVGVELIVVDNGSSDGTASVLERHRERIRILHESTRGASAARNTGIRHARGDRIAFTDADCVVEPDWLVNLIPAIRDPQVGIAGGTILSRQPCNRIEKFGERIHDHRQAIEEESPYAITMNWASRRQVLEEVGLFDEALLRGQDVELARRIRFAGYRIVYCREAVVRHRNEATLRGLFAEGMAHSRGAMLIRAKYPAAAYEDTPHTASLIRRLRRNLFRCLSGSDRFDALCAFVFDAGKLAGQIRSMVGGDRSASTPAQSNSA